MDAPDLAGTPRETGEAEVCSAQAGRWRKGRNKRLLAPFRHAPQENPLPMPLPAATYRLQFRNGMTFETARRRVPAMKVLGVSHLYASPIFTATSGSTHGYDVTDANGIDPVLGGLEGLEALSRALKAEGLGLILDIVPNHMAPPWKMAGGKAWCAMVRRARLPAISTLTGASG